MLLCVWAPETCSNIPAIVLMDTVLWGRKRRLRLVPASTSGTGNFEGVSENLRCFTWAWERLVITCCRFPFECLNSSLCSLLLPGLKKQFHCLSLPAPNWSNVTGTSSFHSQAISKNSHLCTRAHTVVKMKGKRKL